MSTIRVVRRTAFATIDKRALEDDRLSFRARGVLGWLLAKPDDWNVDSTAIARHGTEGREAVRTALRELETLGYLRREKRQASHGHWVTESVVYETPTDAQEPVSGPTPRNPTPGNPTVGELGAKGQVLRLMIDTENTGAMPLEVPDPFDAFWDEYPRKVEKQTARKRWQAQVKRGTDPRELVAAGANYARAKRGTPPDKIKHAATFLSADDVWRDWLDGGAALAEAEQGEVYVSDEPIYS